MKARKGSYLLGIFVEQKDLDKIVIVLYMRRDNTEIWEFVWSRE